MSSGLDDQSAVEAAYSNLMRDPCHVNFLAEHDRPFDANRWKQEFLTASADLSNPSARLRRGKLLVVIARGTVQVCLAGAYLGPDSGLVQITPDASVIGTVVHDDGKEPLSIQDCEPVVSVLNADCVDVAIDLVAQGFRPALLNMANDAVAGGGWKSGAGAQEEDLFRRGDYHARVKKEHYPLPEFACVFTPGVRYFRRSREEGYAFMPAPTPVDTIACAAYVRPPTQGVRLAMREEKGTLRKLRAVFSAAKQHGSDSLVLSAFGCGAFGNPPTAIAALIKQVCKEYHGFFGKIVIAIIENDGLGNLEAFQREFGQFV